MIRIVAPTVYPKKYAHDFVVLCFVVVMQSFIMNSHEVFIHINQGCFAGTGAIVRLPQCQWSKPDGYGIISQCITTTKHSKAKTMCIFLGIYCSFMSCNFLFLLWLFHRHWSIACKSCRHHRPFVAGIQRHARLSFRKGYWCRALCNPSFHSWQAIQLAVNETEIS